MRVAHSPKLRAPRRISLAVRRVSCWNALVGSLERVAAGGVVLTTGWRGRLALAIIAGAVGRLEVLAGIRSKAGLSAFVRPTHVLGG